MEIEFPSLPKFLSSDHRYGRLSDQSSAIHLGGLPFRSKFKFKHKFKYFFKSSEEKILIVCRESGHVGELKKIISRHQDMNESIFIDGLHLVSYFGHLEAVLFLVDEMQIPIDSTTKVDKWSEPSLGYSLTKLILRTDTLLFTWRA
jgi:hypothetical protein